MQQATIDQAIEREIAATAVHVPLSCIQPGNNDRKTFDTASIARLASDIEQAGLQSPITVRPIGDERYEIVCGERRYRAHQHLGRDTIPCFIREMNDEEADLVMLAENVQRVNLNPVEEAMGFQKQLEKYGRSRDEIAARCNVSVDLVRRRLGLLKLQPDVQHQVATGNLRVTYAECMISLDAHRQTMALRELNHRGDISQKVFARICNELLAQQQQCGMFDDLDLGALFEEKRVEVEIEKHASKAHKETQDELHAEIARLRTELEQEREQRQQVEQERDILRAELEQEREQRQQVEQERDTLRTEQTSQTTQDITHTPVIPFPRKTARKRTHKPAQVRQADVFGFTYQQLEMFSDEEIAQCQHNMHRSSIPTMPIMGNGAWSWYGTPMAA